MKQYTTIDLSDMIIDLSDMIIDLSDMMAQNAEQAQRIADLEAEVERITEAGRVHIRRAAAFEAQRDELAAWKASVEQAEPQAHAVASHGGQVVYWIGATLAEAARFAGQLNCQTHLIRLIARPAPTAAPEQAEPGTCRGDGRCQYAIDHGAEGLGHCPPGKCVMPCEGGAA